MEARLQHSGDIATGFRCPERTMHTRGLVGDPHLDSREDRSTRVGHGALKSALSRRLGEGAGHTQEVQEQDQANRSKPTERKAASRKALHEKRSVKVVVPLQRIVARLEPRVKHAS